MIPSDVRIFGEPCHLLFSIDAGVLSDAVERHVEWPVAVEVSKDFFVAHGVEGVALAEWEHPLRLFEKSGFDHGGGAAVDAVEEFGAWALQSDFDNAKRPLLVPPFA